MKHSLTVFAALLLAVAGAFAQPRSVGLRIGATGLDAAYQHNMNKNQFVEGNFGLDFGYNADGHPGVRATAVYDFVWARPAWTDRGDWALYAGPGLSLGYVYDLVPYRIADVVKPCKDNGFMLALAAQVGIEYTFWFPLALSVDLRPCFGFHINDGRFREPGGTSVATHAGKVGFYDNGLLGFAPTISARYCF